VVEENVLAWRIVRLHGAESAQATRFTDKASAAPADAQVGGGQRHDDAADADAGRLARCRR
jgi:hypothetical protein